MKPNKKEERICLFSLAAMFLIYVCAMVLVSSNYTLQPVTKDMILRGRIRVLRRSVRVGRGGRTTRFLAFK